MDNYTTCLLDFINTMDANETAECARDPKVIPRSWLNEQQTPSEFLEDTHVKPMTILDGW